MSELTDVKTEHSGAKHGNGAYWGRKVDAKAKSNKVRRANELDLEYNHHDHSFSVVVDDERGNDTGFRLCSESTCWEVGP